MVYFQTKTKNPNSEKFWSSLEREKLVPSMAIWKTLRPFGTFCSHLVIWRKFGIFSSVLVYCQDKSGNPLANYDLH
jgi:hypothetical protein